MPWRRLALAVLFTRKRPPPKIHHRAGDRIIIGFLEKMLNGGHGRWPFLAGTAPRTCLTGGKTASSLRVESL